VLDAPWLSMKRTAPVTRPTTNLDDRDVTSPSNVAAPPVVDDSVTRTSRVTPISPTSVPVPVMVPVTPYPSGDDEPG